MSLHINFELSQADLNHFCAIMRRARENVQHKSDKQIIDRAEQLLAEVNRSDATDFIRDRVGQLAVLIAMLEDSGWGLEEDDRERVLAALSYFSEPEDIIPDNIPGLGFLDDAIMIEIVCKELEHEMQAYRDFIAFRTERQSNSGDDAPELQRSDWLEERRQQLHSRMRRRRKGRSDVNRTKSPFSLL